MTLPRNRKIVLCVISALAAMTGSQSFAQNTIALESATSLSPKQAQTKNNDAASFVSAERIEGNPEDQLHLYGNAEIRRGGAVLRGDEITYTQATDEVQAKGNAHIARQGASFSGPSMRFRITSRSGEMRDAQYEYAPRNIRGCAKNIRFLSGDKTTFEDVKITTCKRDDEAWFIKLDKLSVDEYDQTASGRNATLHFLGVPVFGSPWFAFPVSKERRSGFLVPTYGMSSSRGVDLTIPYYLNIAPNYDMTLTPRIMSKRGVMLGTETRVLFNNLFSQVNFDYLPRDSKTHDDRYSLRVQNHYRYNKFTADIDYNRVSDNDFLSDFSGNIRESSESVLPQEYKLGYHEKYWNASLNVTKNQSLRVEGQKFYKPYERVPQLSLHGYAGDYNGFELKSTLEATRFKGNNRIDGDRFVAEQSIAYPLQGAGWFIVPKASALAVAYHLNDTDRYRAYNDKSPTRFTPTFSLDTGLIFERESSWFGRAALQTLEPRIYYTRTPYRDQSDIPIFDTWVSDLNITTLFKPNAFTGYDRVSEADQLSAALTTRYIDNATGLELFRATIAQRQYFGDQRVTFPQDMQGYLHNDPSRINGSRRSDLLSSASARLSKHLRADMDTQYSSSDSKLVRFSSGVTWNPRHMSLIGLHYRYNRTGMADDHIKQLDLSVQWPITQRLYGLLRYNYSIYQHEAIEALAGFEYLHDCWTLRFVAQRYNTALNTKESNFFLQLELNGLGSIGTSPLSELKRNIKGYQSSNAVPEQTGLYDYYE